MTTCALVVAGCSGGPDADPAPHDDGACIERLVNAPRSASDTNDRRAATPDAPAPEDPSGTWYVTAGGARYTLVVSRDGRGALAGTMAPDGGEAAPVADVAWDREHRRLRFRHDDAGGRAWFDVALTEAVMVGRFARGDGAAAPGAAGYTSHVTGWSATAIDRDVVPRTWDLRSGDGLRARLRVDRDASGKVIGTLKVYARDGDGVAAEELEHDLTAVSWDGARLSFTVARDGADWAFAGDARGRALRLQAARPADAAPVTWEGGRVEVLSHGIAPRDQDELAAWRARTRRELSALMMAGAPAPRSARVEVVRSEVVPPTVAAGGARQPGYTLSELRLELAIADPRGGADLVRRAHAFMARPPGPAPAGGLPVALAFNGHGGSARKVMSTGNMYWYGDAYARRGYLVVAVDVSHRPRADRADLYTDYPDGDAAADGNGAHPAIASPGFDTDWEEDGERAWDAMRALDYALAQPGVRARRVVATGLSLGAEVATLVGALDTRVSAVVAAGFSPDLAVMRLHGNHACWRWRHADIEEYVDTSDLHALIAPRALVVETGAADRTFSSSATPFAADKQVLRRSRVAFSADGGCLVHDLHRGGHDYHVGDPSYDASARPGVTVPVVIAPTTVAPLRWQVDAVTRLLPTTVFDLTLIRARP